MQICVQRPNFGWCLIAWLHLWSWVPYTYTDESQCISRMIPMYCDRQVQNNENVFGGIQPEACTSCAQAIFANIWSSVILRLPCKMKKRRSFTCFYILCPGDQWGASCSGKPKSAPARKHISWGLSGKASYIGRKTVGHHCTTQQKYLKFCQGRSLQCLIQLIANSCVKSCLNVLNLIVYHQSVCKSKNKQNCSLHTNQQSM